MNIRRLFSDRIIAEAERQSHLAHILFDTSPTLTRTLAHIATIDAQCHDKLFSTEAEKLKRWFLEPSDEEDALVALGILMIFYGPTDYLTRFTLTQTILLDLLSRLLTPALGGLGLDHETASRRLLQYLAELNPKLLHYDDHKQVREQLQMMFQESQLSWSALVNEG